MLVVVRASEGCWFGASAFLAALAFRVFFSTQYPSSMQAKEAMHQAAKAVNAADTPLGTEKDDGEGEDDKPKTEITLAILAQEVGSNHLQNLSSNLLTLKLSLKVSYALSCYIGKGLQRH